MICTQCGQEVRGHVCRACQALRTRRGILLHQRRFLATWLAGQIDLRVKRIDGVLHLELFDDRWHSYCGVEMFSAVDREFVKLPPADLCAACLKVFDGLIAEAKEV
jgi:hypothetical protein